MWNTSVQFTNSQCWIYGPANNNQDTRWTFIFWVSSPINTIVCHSANRILEGSRQCVSIWRSGIPQFLSLKLSKGKERSVWLSSTLMSSLDWTWAREELNTVSGDQCHPLHMHSQSPPSVWTANCKAYPQHRHWLQPQWTDTYRSPQKVSGSWRREVKPTQARSKAHWENDSEVCTLWKSNLSSVLEKAALSRQI